MNMRHYPQAVLGLRKVSGVRAAPGICSGILWWNDIPKEVGCRKRPKVLKTQINKLNLTGRELHNSHIYILTRPCAKSALHRSVLPKVFKKGCSFFCHTAGCIEIVGSAPRLPVLPHGFAILRPIPFIETEFKFLIPGCFYQMGQFQKHFLCQNKSFGCDECCYVKARNKWPDAAIVIRAGGIKLGISRKPIPVSRADKRKQIWREVPG